MRSLCVSCEGLCGTFAAETQDKHRLRAHDGCVTDVPPESRPVPPQPDHDVTRVLPPDQPPAEPKPRFVDRLWSLRAVIAVALASVILGGLGGAALANVGDHDDRRMGPGRFRGGGPMMVPPGSEMPPPGTQQWRWRDGTRGDPMPRWRSPGQWDERGPGGAAPTLPPSPPTAVPTPDN